VIAGFTGRHGSVIYLCSYLSTMFNISDVMIDKEESSMTFQVPLHIPEDLPLPETETVTNEQITIWRQKTAFQDRTPAFQNRTVPEGFKRWRKSFLHKGFRAVNVPKPNIML